VPLFQSTPSAIARSQACLSASSSEDLNSSEWRSHNCYLLSPSAILVTMVNTTTKKLTQAEFWALADASDLTYELIDGVAVPKMSPKYFHAKSTLELVRILDRWSDNRGRLGIEWALDLNENYTPVPDLIYISYERLAQTWHENAACPVPPELAIEIISPGQTFGEMTQKASVYLAAGVLRVWVVDTIASSVTVFYPDAAPVTYTGDRPITDSIFPGLSIVPQQLF
jgi:Uma2 family endonuclease